MLWATGAMGDEIEVAGATAGEAWRVHGRVARRPERGTADQVKILARRRRLSRKAVTMSWPGLAALWVPKTSPDPAITMRYHYRPGPESR